MARRFGVTIDDLLYKEAAQRVSGGLRGDRYLRHVFSGGTLLVSTYVPITVDPIDVPS